MPPGLIKFNQDKLKISLESSKSDYVDKIFNYYVTSWINPPPGMEKIYVDWGPFSFQVKPVIKYINSAPPRFNLKSKYYVFENTTVSLNLGAPDSYTGNNLTTELTDRSG